MKFPNMNSLKGWRTRIVAGLHAVLGFIAIINPNTLELVASEDGAARNLGIMMMVQGGAIYWLRQVTTTPPGKRL